MEAANSHQTGRWYHNRLLWIIAAFTLLWTLAIAVNLSPWLLGPSGKWEWRWKYRPQGFYPVRMALALLMAALVMGWYWLARQRERVSTGLLGLLVPISLALQLAVLSNTPTGLQIVARVLNPAYFGYYPPATHVEDLGPFLDHYAASQPDFEHPRLQTHPPGNVVFEYAILKTVQNLSGLFAPFIPQIDARRAALPDWASDYNAIEVVGGIASTITIMLLASFAIIPLYLLARQSDEELARRTAVLYLLMPALTLFEPKIDVAYTLLATLAYMLAYVGVSSRRIWMVYLSGLVCSAGMFASYSLAPLSLAIGILVLGDGLAEWRSRRKTIRQVVGEIAILTIGGITVQILTALLLGYEPVQAYLVMRDETARYNTLRNYWYSLVYTPYDLLLFAGIPSSLLLVGQWVRLMRQMRARELPSRLGWIAIGGTAAMALLTLSGIQKAENARVFLYFMPLMVLIGAKESIDLDISPPGFALIAALTAAQLLIFQATLEVFL